MSLNDTPERSTCIRWSRATWSGNKRTKVDLRPACFCPRRIQWPLNTPVNLQVTSVTPENVVDGEESERTFTLFTALWLILFRSQKKIPWFGNKHVGNFVENQIKREKMKERLMMFSVSNFKDNGMENRNDPKQAQKHAAAFCKTTGWCFFKLHVG